MGTPTDIPQNDPQNTLIMHKWGKNFFSKKVITCPHIDC